MALCALERDLLGAIAANRVRFRLAGAAAAVTSGGGAGPGGDPAAARTFTWDKGLLSEAKVTEIAKRHASA